jgi:hypothetical protein
MSANERITMYEHTYKGISLLETCYFRLLCATRGLNGTYTTTLETGGNPCSTYTIAVSGRETYNVMQKVVDEANG